nr:hypothetical protein [uncultured Desulfobulbus sp.]
MTSSSISRRIKKSIEAFGKKDYEDAFVQLFPAIDKTAKKRRPRDGVGARIKSFISDEEKIITAVATNNILTNVNVNGIDFPTALYKFGRTSIIHEGELDDRLKINEQGNLQIGHIWNLPASYITGLIVAVIVAPENSGENINENIGINLFGEQYKVNDLWGNLNLIQSKICVIFGRNDLFN